MSLKITHKSSTVTGTPPASGDIDVGEIAINAADAELYTKDTVGNIRKFQNTTTGTADGVQFTQTGTGAVPRTVESKLQDTVSVRDFGAVGNEVRDDRADIQAAMDYCAANSLTLDFGSNTYLLDSTGGDTPVVKLDGVTTNRQKYCLNYPNGLSCKGDGAVLKLGSSLDGIGQLSMSDSGVGDNAMNIPIAINLESAVSKIYWEGVSFAGGWIIGIGKVDVGTAINNCYIKNTTFSDCGIGLIVYGLDRVDLLNLRFTSCQAGIVAGGMYFTVSDNRDNKSNVDKCYLDNHYYIFSTDGYTTKGANIDKYFDKYFYKNNQSTPTYSVADVKSGNNSSITQEGVTLIDDAVAGGSTIDSAVDTLISTNPRVQGLGASSGFSNTTYRGISGYGFISMSRYTRSATAPVVGKVYMQHGWRSAVSFDLVNADFGYTLKAGGEDCGWINPGVVSSSGAQRYTWGDISGSPLIDDPTLTSTATYSDPYQGRGVRFPYFVRAGDGSVTVSDCSYKEVQLKKRYLPREIDSKIQTPQTVEIHPTSTKFSNGATFGPNDESSINSGGSAQFPGTVTIGGGSAGSAQFPGSVSVGGTATANTIDIYEEGTWTPGIEPTSGTYTTMNVNVVKATYTRIGNIVSVQCFIRTTNVDTTGGSGAMKITGLPYSVSSTTYRTMGSALSMEYNSNGTYNDTFYTRMNDSNFVIFIKCDAAGVANATVLEGSQLQQGSVTNRNRMVFSLVYATD
jgi:hypothetical protein